MFRVVKVVSQKLKNDKVEATTEQQAALVKAVTALQLRGEAKATKAVTKLLLERGLINPSLRQQIKQKTHGQGQ